MRIIKYIIIATLLFTPVLLSAGHKDTLRSVSTRQKREIQMLEQLFKHSSNVAGMGKSKVDDGSDTYMSYYIDGGNHHRVQEGSSNNRLTFATERYDSFSDKLFMNGSFTFNLHNEMDRKWSDAMNTYNSNPFIYGSSVARDYATQHINLKFKLYTAPLNDFISLGFGFDYSVADFSGNRDPRPRTNYMDAKLIPSILFKLNENNSIGVSINYAYRKEKLLGLTTIQSYPNLEYYDFKGLDNYESKIGGYTGFARQFISNGYGIGIQYNLTLGGANILLAGSYDFLLDNVYETQKSSPGSYSSDKLNVTADVSFGSEYKSFIKLKGEKLIGSANQHIQELVQTRDSVTQIVTQTWETLYTYENRYFVETMDIGFDWRLLRIINDGDNYKWSANLRASYSVFENRYYLPYSDYGASKYMVGLGGSYLLFNSKDHSVNVSLGADAALMPNSYYNPAATISAEATHNIYATEVLTPDLAYYSRSYLNSSAQIEYNFPISIKKRSQKILGYVKLDGSYLAAEGNYNWFSVALTLGLLTF